MAITLDGIYVNGQKATFAPEDILSGDASAYTEEIGTAVEEWLEENVTGGEQVTDTTLTLPGVPADSKKTGDEIGALKEDLNSIPVVILHEKANFIDLYPYAEGKLNTNTGEVQNTTADHKKRYTSDFIPVAEGDILWMNQIELLCTYDSEKVFKANWNSGRQNPVSLGVAYIRFSFMKDYLGTAYMIKRYDYGKVNDEGYINRGYTDNFVTSAKSAYNDIANSSDIAFVKNNNLFDYVHDEYYSNGQVNRTNGNYTLAGTAPSKVINGTNIYLGIATYYPVTAGQVLMCNYDTWDSAYYDEDKIYIGTLPAMLRNNFSGKWGAWKIPDGCAYVRLNIKGESINPTAGKLASEEDIKKIIICTVDAEQIMVDPTVHAIPQYQINGSMISDNILDNIVPSMQDSSFISAMKCLTVREANARENAYRFGNFNMWVMKQKNGWPMTKKMLMDYGVDFCGFEEVNKTNDQLLAQYLLSWQFADGFLTNFTDGIDPVDKSFVSRYAVLSSTKLSGLSGTINCKVQLPRFLDAYNPFRILSCYIIHCPIAQTADKIAFANALLAVINNDPSDYIVIMGDTNDFGASLETKSFWKTLSDAGYTPVLPITSKTVTQDNFTIDEGDPSLEWRSHAIDQFFVSSNIRAINYGITNTKDKYYVNDGNAGVNTDNQPALSDHDFVWCDLKFLDEVRSNYPVA